jgi:excinuclease ABC subunit A
LYARYGNIIGIDAELVVPNTTLSVYENAVFPWRSMSWFRDELVNNAYKFDFPIHKPYYELTGSKKIDMDRKYFQGLNDFFKN